MSYCTVHDITSRFSELEIVQLTDTDNTGAINLTALNAALADATADIDAALIRYTLPLQTVPENITRIACDLTRYYLYKNDVTKLVQQRYDIANQYLLMVATGKISLVNIAVNSAPNSPLVHSQPAQHWDDY